MTTSTVDAGVPVTFEVHRLSAADVVTSVGSDRLCGLPALEAARRLQTVGPNVLAAAERVPGWRRFLEQFTDRLILILIAAAVVAFAVSGELKTPVVVLAVVVVNAVIGFAQERRAERSLDALRRMLVSQARVRRSGDTVVVPAAEVVPGDVALVEAGDRIPADGRLLLAVGVEVDESALTGESQPVVKAVDPVDRHGVPIGDRSCMTYMNTTVTRGRAELVVTATGMNTEIGRIAGLLQATEVDKTPLQHQLDRLADSLAKLAGVIVAAVMLIGLARGQSIDEMLLTAVALAVAAIPEGLPAVTAVTLAIGVSKMAKRNAIVKRLASVETLGCTSVICSDKTGTLTLNQMTAVEVVTGTSAHSVSGSGYAPCGDVSGDGDPAGLRPALVAMVLCNDAVVRREGDEWTLIGDPTEGALCVLAAKGGVDVAAERARLPRAGEVPFDSGRKFMATAHEVTGADGSPTMRLYVKGAPDVLLERVTTVIDQAGAARPIGGDADRLATTIDEMAARGLRVLAIAQRDIAKAPADGDLASMVEDLCLVALVGIVDPPRPEAATAISEAHRAGVRVVIITGDHAATAAAIAARLGLVGDVVAGVELDRLDDTALAERLGSVAAFARVSPEHKLRLVDALQREGNVVAMTGDGVNDAPALKKADIGVAMGITGTEVTKEAATMILTDDNFATIVGAVRRGRTIYDNIVAFVRFQLSTTIGFAALFLMAGLLGIADGRPFTAVAILWVNLVMDGPPAMALGVDPPARDVMRRRPRPASEPILTRRRWTAIGSSAAVMATGTLAVLAWAPGAEPHPGTATVAGTMAFATFVLFQFFNLLNTRSDTQTVFSRDTFRNRWLWLSLTAVLSLQVAVTHLAPLQRLFDTTSLTLAQWAMCALVASSVLWFEESRKLIHRTTPDKDNQ